MEHASARVVSALEDGSRKIRFCFSDGSVDRMGDTIDPAGWDLAAYRRNPVVLFGHKSTDPPIGRTVNVWSDGQQLMGDVAFADAATYPFADTIFRLLKNGFLTAGSVGFLPLEYDWADDEDSRPYGLDFKRQELLEFSIVPVPANSNALIAAQAKGLLSAGELRRVRSARRRGPAGNCGRPVGNECGLKDPAECAIHGFGEVGVGDAADDTEAAKAAQLRRLRAIKRRLRPMTTRADALQVLAEVRARTGCQRTPARLIAADVAFRFGSG
jgi:HK97 family phage prohead protease